MNKKSLIITTFIISLLMNSSAYCEENSYQEFINNFSACKESIYVGQRSVSFVLGWSNRKCAYKELSHREIIRCDFKELQMNDLKNGMKISDYSPEIGIKSLPQAQKYLEMEDVCKITYKNGGEKAAQTIQYNTTGIYRQPTEPSRKPSITPSLNMRQSGTSSTRSSAPFTPTSGKSQSARNMPKGSSDQSSSSGTSKARGGMGAGGFGPRRGG